jgi:hypothetical protein
MSPRKTTTQEKNPTVQVALITMIGTIAAAIVTGFFSLIPSLNNSTALTSTSTAVPLSTSAQMAATEVASPPVLPTLENTTTNVANSPAPISTEMPTGTPINQNAGNNTTGWGGVLSARMPTLNEIRAEIPVSIWIANVIEVRDMHEPNIDNYSGEARIGTEYVLPTYWCADNTDLLAENMESITTQFFVNTQKIPDQYIFSYTYDTETGWHCSSHSVVLGGWKKGSQYVLDIQRTLATDLSDGQSTYAAGDYIYRLIVKVP